MLQLQDRRPAAAVIRINRQQVMPEAIRIISGPQTKRVISNKSSRSNHLRMPTPPWLILPAPCACGRFHHDFAARPDNIMPIDNSGQFEQLSLYMNKFDYPALPDDVKDAFEKEMLLRLSWNTNHLEGNTLSLDETIDVIEYDEVRSGHSYSEYREAKSAFAANRQMLDFRQPKHIDPAYIKTANAIIMGSDGEYRTGRVYIGTLAESAYVPPAPKEIPALMERYTKPLEDFSYPGHQENPAASGSSDFSEIKGFISETLRAASVLHMDFERIHPFRDGNGRTGRLFLNQYLLNSGLLPAIIGNQSRYRQAFRYYERSGDTTWMEHCIGDGILTSYRTLEENCKKLMDDAAPE